MKTGVIGLGAMGLGMANNLYKHGKLNAVWNRTSSKAEEYAKDKNITLASSPETLAAECNLIITCVSRDQDVLEMINAIAKGIREKAIVVDTSTVSSDTAMQAAEILNNKNAYFLDCPVSGGVEGAKRGSLAMMVGGDEPVLEQARETLSAIASNIAYIGPTGNGQACKAVNQLMAAGINQAVTEALAFGQAMNLDMEKVVDIVSTGAAGNWFLDHRGKSMLNDSFQPGFKLNLHFKDLKICQTMADALSGNKLPVVEMTLLHYQRLINNGFGDEDISALFRLKKQLFQASSQ